MITLDVTLDPDAVERLVGAAGEKDPDHGHAEPRLKIGEVMANQTDLVEVTHTLKQVLCVKGS